MKSAMFVWVMLVSALDFVVPGTRLIKRKMKHYQYTILLLDFTQQNIFVREKHGVICGSMLYMDGRHNHTVEAQDTALPGLACGNLGRAA